MKILKNIFKGCLFSVVIVMMLSVVIALFDSTNETHFSNAQKLYKNGKFSEALTEIGLALQEDTSNQEYKSLQQEIILKNFDSLSSTSYGAKYTSIVDTNNIDFIKSRFRIKLAQSKGSARLYLKEKLSIKEFDDNIYCTLSEYAGKHHLLLSDTNEAVSYYKQSLKRNPKDINLLIKLAGIFSTQHKYSSAIKYYKSALNISPNSAEVNYQYAILNLAKGRKTTAKKYLKKSLDLGDSRGCSEYRELTAKQNYYLQNRCRDGSTSSAVGRRGACSHHGGVSYVERIYYKEYTVSCN